MTNEKTSFMLKIYPEVKEKLREISKADFTNMSQKITNMILKEYEEKFGKTKDNNEI